MRVSPCGWQPDLSMCKSGPCCAGAQEFDGPTQELVLKLAAEVIWRLTGMQFGCCPVSVRPCKISQCEPQSLSDLIFWDKRGRDNMGVFSSTPMLIDGLPYNVTCGCHHNYCTCKANCEFRLPGPVCEITKVTVDGEMVPASDYFLVDRRTLVFTGDTCPSRQDFNLRAGEVGTWSVDYTVGQEVPYTAKVAAGMYACELGRSFSGDDCALPEYVQNIARPGMDIGMVDPIALSHNGKTGLREVDLIITSLNPNRQHAPARVWSPDLPKFRRER